MQPKIEEAGEVPSYLSGMVQMTLHSENANGVLGAPLKFMLRIGMKDRKDVEETFETEGGGTLHGLADIIIARLRSHALSPLGPERGSRQHASIILENVRMLGGKMIDECEDLRLSFAVDLDVDTTELFPGEENVNINVSKTE